MTNEIKKRIEKLKTALNKISVDLAVITQKVNLYYFTGTLQNGSLIVPVNDEPYLFIKRDFDRALTESPLNKIYKISNTKDIKRYLSLEKYKNIGFELDVLPYNQFLKFKEIFNEANIFDISLELRRLRMYKSEMELEKMVQAGILLDKTFDELKSFIKEGMTEIEIAAYLEYLARKNGHMGPVRMRAFNQEMYFGHVLSGESAFYLSYVDSPTSGLGLGSFFPQGASKKRIKNGEVLSIDFVFVYEGYMVDQTRIFSIGEPNEEVKKVFNVALKLMRMLENEIKPGITCDEFVKKVYEIVRQHNLTNIFMGTKGKQASYIGHGLGLELDELPVIAKGVNDRLEQNITFAFEPKFFLHPYGLVGLENTYVMSASGALPLTKNSEDIEIII
jgi:Xaa-Pro dipeptidase